MQNMLESGETSRGAKRTEDYFSLVSLEAVNKVIPLQGLLLAEIISYCHKPKDGTWQRIVWPDNAALAAVLTVGGRTPTVRTVQRHLRELERAEFIRTFSSSTRREMEVLVLPGDQAREHAPGDSDSHRTKGPGFVRSFNRVRRDPRLGYNARLLHALLDWHDLPNAQGARCGIVFPGTAFLAKRSRLSERAVYDALADLERYGYIGRVKSFERRNGRPLRRIHLATVTQDPTARESVHQESLLADIQDSRHSCVDVTSNCAGADGEPPTYDMLCTVPRHPVQTGDDDVRTYPLTPRAAEQHRSNEHRKNRSQQSDHLGVAEVLHVGADEETGNSHREPSSPMHGAHPPASGKPSPCAKPVPMEVVEQFSLLPDPSRQLPPPTFNDTSPPNCGACGAAPSARIGATAEHATPCPAHCCRCRSLRSESSKECSFE